MSIRYRNVDITGCTVDVDNTPDANSTKPLSNKGFCEIYGQLSNYFENNSDDIFEFDYGSRYTPSYYFDGRIKFNKTFRTPPQNIIICGLRPDNDDAGSSITIMTEPTNITVDGFNVYIRNQDDRQGMKYSWFAF